MRSEIIIGSMLCCMLVACVGAAADGKILMVIAQQDFRDEELFEPKTVFEENGAEVLIAAPRMEEARGMLGRTVQPDISIADASADDFDAIVIVGGAGSPIFLWENDELRALVKEAYEKEKIVAAICLSPVVLARAGVLRGKEATADKNAIAEIEAGGASYMDEDVVVADRIVTARDPESSKKFADAIVSLLVEGSERAENAEKMPTPTAKMPTPATSPKPSYPALFIAEILIAHAVARAKHR